MTLGRCLVGTALVLALTGGTAEACLCGGGGLTCQAFYDFPVAFSGRVETIEIVKRSAPPRAFRRVRLEVLEPFRGVSTSHIELTTGFTSCDFDFVVGERYFVYARESENPTTFTTSKCSRTRRLREAADDLMFARAQATAAPTGGSIIGSVLERRMNWTEGRASFSPVSNVSVRVVCDGLVHDAVSDALGEFTIRGLAAGLCTTTAIAPAGMYMLSEEPRKVTVSDTRGCVGLSFMVANDGRISGRVIDAAGNAVRGITVHLFAPGRRTSFPNFEAVTDSTGIFELTKVDAGTYHMSINVRLIDDAQPPTITSIYFPGVSVRAAERRVRLDAGERVEVGDFALPSGVDLVRISGRVIDETGRPAAARRLHLYYGGDASMPSLRAGPVFSDEAGGFVFVIPRDVRASISAMTIAADRIAEQGETGAFTADRHRDDLQIVLKRQTGR